MAQEGIGREATERAKRPLGCLAVVGLGLQWAGQTTPAARRAIERADLVLCAVGDAEATAWIREANDRVVSIAQPLEGRPRSELQRTMVARIIAELERGLRVCAVFYGGPTMLSGAAHEVIRTARERGYPVSMLPGVSFLECLYADLGIDPGERGCAVYEAEDFLRTRRAIDAHAHVVLAQVAAIGEHGTIAPLSRPRVVRSLGLLVQRLRDTYPSTHPAVLYEAATHPAGRFRAEGMQLLELPRADVGERSALYLPPLGPAPRDEEMCRLLAQLQAAALR